MHHCRDRRESPCTHQTYRCVSSSLRSGHPTRLIVRRGCDADAGHDVLCCRWREEMQIVWSVGAFRGVLVACLTVVSWELGFVVVISVRGDGGGERGVGGNLWGPLDTGLDLCQWSESFCRVVCVVVFVLLLEHYLYCFYNTGRSW